MEEEKIDINSKGYELVNKLFSEKIIKSTIPQELSGSLKERGSVKLPNPVDTDKRSIRKTVDYADRTIEIAGIVGDFEVGFDQTSYPILKKLISYTQRIYFEDLASTEYLESEALEWCLQIYESNRSTIDLLPYLQERVQASLMDHTFYFPVDNMHIENPFDLGNTYFCFFSEKEMDEYYTKLTSKEGSTWTEDTFSNLFRSPFQGVVLAKVTVHSERGRAEDLAKEIASLAVDVLKFHTDNLTVPDFKVTFDLNYRLNYQRKSVFLTGEGLKDHDMGYNVKFNTSDYRWTDERLEFNFRKSMGLFANFIVQRRSDELYRLIIQAINSFASALSNWDLNQRCISLITILESLLLKYEEMYRMEMKVKQRAIKLACLTTQEDEAMRSYLSNIYQVRHKMVHKAIRLNIDMIELGKTQTTVMVVLMKLIMLNSRFFFKEELIEYIDSVERVDGLHESSGL